MLLARAPVALAHAPRATAPTLLGVWQNPSRSARIRTPKCGASICGVVVYANAKAKADAANGGTDKLIGLNLFQESDQTAPDTWTGKVMVPDLNRSVAGKITLVDGRTMNVEGWIVGHMTCKGQI